MVRLHLLASVAVKLFGLGRFGLKIELAIVVRFQIEPAISLMLQLCGTAW